MKKNFVTAVVVLFMISLCTLNSYAQNEKSEKLKSQIEALNAKMIKAVKADDHKTLSAMYTDDVYSMPSYSPMTTSKQAMIEREMKNHEAGYKMTSMKFDVVDVIPAGDYVIEIGKYNVTMVMPMMPEPMNDKGKYVTVWQKQKDGSLKVKVETWNSDINPMEMGEKMHHDNDKMHDVDGRK